MSEVLLGLFGIVCMAGALRGCMEMADDSKMVHCVAHAVHFSGELKSILRAFRRIDLALRRS